ncbi:MAG: methyltransferase domain-containing protein [Winogradskyella sp.]|uniref:methyltransferase domain-containing protein n=1 Tax=Winogradskyella sp. TaxID=1883156 RepID=UPI0025FDC9FF|nr:methyltransferase domain-containing protein [Winogradskyella sp.]NRB58732.1 methyltransferase domain-containing protein [Winogradskyella sp.]
MTLTNLDSDYWEKRYQNNQTGWDIGEPSTPIKTYVDQLKDKNIKILIPGGGNSYEAEYLWHNGFKNIFVADIALSPLKNLKQRVEDFPDSQLLHSDFFKLDNKFDFIIEQTFFCALNPDLRMQYTEQMLKLLKSHGKLVGLLFDFELTSEGPPFGGSIEEYQNLFQNGFRIKTLEKSRNSIKPREGKELFFIFEKR